MHHNTLEASDANRLVRNPKVTVLMITYNHGPYLSEAIEGIINQNCDFPFELIIGEDASTDSTREIALRYQSMYPEIIRVVHSPNNVGMNENAFRIFERARGDYIAWCEGDDFWCAGDKLAKQVSLMESNNQIGIVHTDWACARMRDGRWKYDLKKSVHSRVREKYLSGNVFETWYYPKILRTCTILLRKKAMQEWYDSGLMDRRYLFGDSVLSFWVTSRAQVGYLPAVMSVYRVSPNSALRSGAAARVRFYRSALDFDSAAHTFYSGNASFPLGYRWEAAAGLLLWGIHARDPDAIKDAIFDFKQHFTVKSFISTGWKSVIMRLPTLNRQPRDLPDHQAARTAHS